MKFKEITFGSEDYRDEVALRYKVLRLPLGLTFDPEVLALEGADHHLCAFTDDGLLVGCLLMVLLESGVVKMRQFAVDPDHQSKGIGKALVAYAESWALQKGYRRIELHARETAVPFYLRLGYTIQGEEFTEVTIAHYFMFKDL